MAGIVAHQANLAFGVSPRTGTRVQGLKARPEFVSEIQVNPKIQEAIDENHRRQAEAGETLELVAGL